MKSNPPAGSSGTSGKILLRAVKIVAGCDSGRWTLDDALDQSPAEFRRALNHLLMSFFRYRRFLEKSLKPFIRRPPQPEVQLLLMLCLAQCRFQSAISPQSAVNVAVDLARKFRASGFVNAVMRRVLENLPPLPESPEEILPPEIAKIWSCRFAPEVLAEFTGLFLTEAPFSFRLLPGAEMPEFAREITAFGPFRFAVTDEPGKLLGSPEFLRGDYYIQDSATSFAPSLVLPFAQNIRSALDLCAAPGGKTLMLSEILPEAELTAADISASRQQRTAENLKLRNCRNCRIITAAPEEINETFDLVFADVPCSNSGVFRRRPDALWRFTGASFAAVTGLQKKIIERAAQLVNPGGFLVISSCSIEPGENQELADHLVRRMPQFKLLEARTILPESGHDGAFGAILQCAGSSTNGAGS